MTMKCYIYPFYDKASGEGLETEDTYTDAGVPMDGFWKVSDMELNEEQKRTAHMDLNGTMYNVWGPCDDEPRDYFVVVNDEQLDAKLKEFGQLNYDAKLKQLNQFN